MKPSLLVILAFVFTYAISACGQSTEANVSPSASPKPLAVEDQNGLLSALKAAGATVEVGDSMTQDFFNVEGQMVKVNGADLQVFEYENADAMEKDASQVAPNGGSIGTSMVSWIDTPHFYKAGRIIVLYIGSDQKVLDLLNKILGPQFAGQ